MDESNDTAKRSNSVTPPSGDQAHNPQKLTDRERYVLADIERSLAFEDPTFARRMTVEARQFDRARTGRFSRAAMYKFARRLGRAYIVLGVGLSTSCMFAPLVQLRSPERRR